MYKNDYQLISVCQRIAKYKGVEPVFTSEYNTAFEQCGWFYISIVYVFHWFNSFVAPLTHSSSCV